MLPFGICKRGFVGSGLTVGFSCVLSAVGNRLCLIIIISTPFDDFRSMGYFSAAWFLSLPMRQVGCPLSSLPAFWVHYLPQVNKRE